MSKSSIHNGTCKQVARPVADSRFTIVRLNNGTAIGESDEGSLIPGCEFDFYGHWKEHPQYGRQFAFSHFAMKAPHTKHGVVKYLQKYAPGVGPRIAAQMFDLYEGDAVQVLRESPLQVASEVKALTPERAEKAARALEGLRELEDTRIRLTNLFAGRGFPGVLVEQCIDRWKLSAPQRVKKNPFSLLVHGLAGCGFARCDRLYLDLGHDPTRLKRQVICLWHVVSSDMSGNTWLPARDCVRRLGEHVSAAAVDGSKAVKLGVRSGWLARRKDEEGQVWLAGGEQARNEKYLAGRLRELGG